MLTSCYLVNISPLVPLGFDILKKVWTGKEISYNHMKVFGFDILAFASRRNGNKSPDRIKSSHRRKSLFIINPMLLSKTPGNKASLVAINSAIRSSLDLTNPFTTDSRFSRGEINQIPCSSLMQCIQLFFHSLLP